MADKIGHGGDELCLSCLVGFLQQVAAPLQNEPTRNAKDFYLGMLSMAIVIFGADTLEQSIGHALQVLADCAPKVPECNAIIQQHIKAGTLEIGNSHGNGTVH